MAVNNRHDVKKVVLVLNLYPYNVIIQQIVLHKKHPPYMIIVREGVFIKSNFNFRKIVYFLDFFFLPVSFFSGVTTCVGVGVDFLNVLIPPSNLDE